MSWECCCAAPFGEGELLPARPLAQLAAWSAHEPTLAASPYALVSHWCHAALLPRCVQAAAPSSALSRCSLSRA